MLFVFFFFKQKTAYEMRISDWSSDVCSSDLLGDPCGSRRRAERGGLGGAAARGHGIRGGVRDGQRRAARQLSQRWHRFQRHRGLYGASQRPAGKDLFHRLQGRSEEHTSELQSLMRSSYAVFCLKKKKTP